MGVKFLRGGMHVQRECVQKRWMDEALIDWLHSTAVCMPENRDIRILRQKIWKFYARELQILRTILVNSVQMLHSFASRFFHFKIIGGIAVRPCFFGFLATFTDSLLWRRKHALDFKWSSIVDLRSCYTTTLQVRQNSIPPFSYNSVPK